MNSVSKLVATAALLVGIPIAIEAMAILNQAAHAPLPSPVWFLALALVGMGTLQQKRAVAEIPRHSRR